MALSDMALGVNNSIQQQLAQRLQAQAVEREMAQQQFQNQMAEKQFASNEELKRAQLADISQSRADATADRRMGLADTLADQIPAGAEMAESDPAVGLMRAGGRGAFLRTRGMEAPAPPEMLQAPGEDQPEELPGTMPSSPMPGAPRIVIKSASANQLNTAEDNRRAAETAAQNAPDAKFEQFTRQEDYKRQNAPPVQGPVSPDQKFEQWQRQYDYENANPKGGKAAAGAAGAPSQYALDTATRTISAIDDVLPKINAQTSGFFGSLASKVGGTPAANVSADLSTVAANVAFNALQAMRDASKTGGALGAISEKELDLLSAVQASIRQNQSPANLRKNLETIKESQQRWLAAAQMGQPGRTGGAAETPAAPKAGDTKTFPNGRTAVYDGQGWAAQ